jgi:hypothetical protein
VTAVLRRRLPNASSLSFRAGLKVRCRGSLF